MHAVLQKGPSLVYSRLYVICTKKAGADWRSNFQIKPVHAFNWPPCIHQVLQQQGLLGRALPKAVSLMQQVRNSIKLTEKLSTPQTYRKEHCICPFFTQKHGLGRVSCSQAQVCRLQCQITPSLDTVPIRC